MTEAGAGRPAVLVALAALHLLLLASTFNALGQALPFMLDDLKFSWTEAGFGFTLLGLACGLSSLLPAALVRRMGVAATFLLGALLLAGGFALFATTRTLLAYQVGAVLLGVGYSCCGPVPAVHVLSAEFRRRSLALGAYFTVGSLGAVVGPVSVFLVHGHLGGWRSYWWLCAAAALLLGGAAAWVTRGPITASEPTSAPAERGWAVRDAVASPQFWVVVAAYTGCLLVNTTVHGLAFQHLLDRGLAAGPATAWIAGAATVGALGAAVAGIAGERMDGRRLTLLSLGSLGLTGLSLALAGGTASLLLFALSFGLGLGFSYVGTALLLGQWFGERAALELYSVMTVVSTLAAAGPVVGGMLHDRTGSFGSTFMLLAAIDLGLMALVAAMRRPSRAGLVTT